MWHKVAGQILPLSLAGMRQRVFGIRISFGFRSSDLCLGQASCGIYPARRSASIFACPRNVRRAIVLPALITEWNIQSRAHGCESCGKRFADQEHYHTLLFDEKNGFRRLDVCNACWEGNFRDSKDGQGYISYWQGVYEAPPPVTEPIQKENAETLLRKLIERNDPQYGPASYILAVMLERKRLLKVKEQIRRDGKRIFIYEQPKTGDLFTIADPDLRLDQLEQVQHDVATLLEHGLNPPPVNPAPLRKSLGGADARR